MSAQTETIVIRPDRTRFAVGMIVFVTSTVACSDLAAAYQNTPATLIAPLNIYTYPLRLWEVIGCSNCDFGGSDYCEA